MDSVSKPKLRLLHGLARTGGTIISRCIASMNDICFIGEVHPSEMESFHPIQQAKDWYGLSFPYDNLSYDEETYATYIADIVRASEAQSKTLVLRDWTHIDFIGVPITPIATFAFTAVEYLEQEFDLVRTCLTRHPIQQFLSFRSKIVDSEGVTPEYFLSGYRAYAEEAAEIGFHRYEDLLVDEGAFFENLCQSLDIPFDPTYVEKWPNYENYTGDVIQANTGKKDISVCTEWTPTSDIITTFRECEDYQVCLDLFGYSDDVTIDE